MVYRSWYLHHHQTLPVIFRADALFLPKKWLVCFFQRGTFSICLALCPSWLEAEKNMTTSWRKIAQVVGVKNLRKSTHIFLRNLTNKKQTNFSTSLGPSVALLLVCPNWATLARENPVKCTTFLWPGIGLFLVLIKTDLLLVLVLLLVLIGVTCYWYWYCYWYC